MINSGQPWGWVEIKKEVKMDSGLYYLFLAYTILWIISFGYTFFIGKRYRDVKNELEHLEKVLREK